MKVHWLIPLTCDETFQFTSKNELARAYRELGHEITTTVAYVNERTTMDGFTNVEYVYTPRGSLNKKIVLHWRMLKSTWTTDADVVMFGFTAAHLLPFAWGMQKVMRKKKMVKKFIMDIRTIPVDVAPGFAGWLNLKRFNLALWLADCFCDGLTVITPMLKNKVQPKVHKLGRKIGIWNSGVNLNHFKREGKNHRKELGLDGKIVLLYHGVLSPNRGLQNVLGALNILRKDCPDLLFLIIGEGSGRSELEEITKKLDLTNKVRFIGKIPYSEVPAYVRSANMAILPFPNIEWWAVSSPLKLMEYLAAGIPTVATDIEAHRLVISQTGGAHLAQNETPEALAAAILHVMNNDIEPVAVEKLQHTISWTTQAQELQKYLLKL